MTLGVCGAGHEVGAQAARALTLSSFSLVCTALRGKLGVFSEMEANFKVCGPVQPLSLGHLQHPEPCPTVALLLALGGAAVPSACPWGEPALKCWGIT